MFAKIALIIDGIKGVIKIGEMISKWYESYQDRQIDKHYEKKASRRRRLLIELEANKDNDEKLKEIQLKLATLDSTTE
ncbi:hypothetical protein [Kangiella sp.]|uniref:hypothetical protein n=1 Tax=Kangiella sp. TaxID=1920245 RepID=UPI003A91A80E